MTLWLAPHVTAAAPPDDDDDELLDPPPVETVLMADELDAALPDVAPEPAVLELPQAAANREKSE